MTRSRDLANFADSTEFTAADNTKLDGIEASATADQTNAEIKTAVEAGADIALGGNPTTTTQSAGNNTTRLATTAFTQAAITALVDSSPASLNTLNELAAALGDDANFSTTVTNSIATKLPLAGGTLTGNITNSQSSFVITNNDLRLKTSGDETMLRAVANGAVELMHNNAVKLATTATGVTATGLVTGTTASFTRLEVNASNTKLKGDLLANSDAAFDIGASGANRPRNLYLSNSIVAGDITTTGVGAFGGSVTVGTTVNTSGTVTVKHTDGVANVSLSPTSTGGVVNVRNASGVGVVTLDGRNSKVTVAGAILAGTDVGVEGSTGKPVMQNAAGSVSFPSYTFYGDGNTGMYRIGSDVIGFGTAGAERVRIDSTGIAFHGDTATANHLNDYEEGSYDVSIVMASGTCTVATNYNGMKYTKIGRMVTVQGQIRVSSVSNPSGLMRISLPFAIDQTNDEGRNISGCVPRLYQASVPSGGLYPYLATVFNIGAYAQLEWVRNNATTINHVPAADEYYIINFSYFTA